jgi:hypothetical protein
MGEILVQIGNAFADSAVEELGASRAGFVADDGGEALIACGRPEGCFAEAGPAEQRDAFRVDSVIRHEVIQGAAERPRPFADGAEIIAPILKLGIEGFQALIETVFRVWIDIATSRSSRARSLCRAWLRRATAAR